MEDKIEENDRRIKLLRREMRSIRCFGERTVKTGKNKEDEERTLFSREEQGTLEGTVRSR